MRLAQIYIAQETKSLLYAIAEHRSPEPGQLGMKVTPDQVGDELLMEIILDKYPNAQKFIDEMNALRKGLASAIKKGKNEY